MSTVSRTVRGFFAGAQVIDVDRSAAPAPAPYTLRCYFVAPAVAVTDGDRPLTFPSSSALFADFGDRPERQSTFYMVRDTVRAHARIALPTGTAPARLPDGFSFDLPAAGGRAAWSYTGGVCETDVTISSKLSAVRPDQFAQLYRAIQSLRAWLDQPVALTRQATDAIAATAPEIDLPLLPTGDGEIDLVDQRYPESGDSARRIQALQRTLQYFPKDKVTVFRASVRLAVIDWNADRNQAAYDRLSTLLADYAGQVPPETYGWAEIYAGLALRDLHRIPEAITRLEHVARNTAVSDSRRSDAAADLAGVLLPDHPKRALAILLETTALPDGYTPAAEAQVAHALLVSNRTHDLEQRVRQRLASHPDSSEDYLLDLASAARRWKLSGDEARMVVVADTIDRLYPKAADKLRAALSECRLAGATHEIIELLRGKLARPPFAGWYQPPLPAGAERTAQSFQQAFDQASTAEDPARCVQVRLQKFLELGGGEGFADELWEAASFAEWAERKLGLDHFDRGICDALLELCDRLPAGHADYFEGRFLRAKRLGRDGDSAGERALLQQLVSSSGLPVSFYGSAAKKLGANFELAGDYEGALGAYRLAEKALTDYGMAGKDVSRAVLINLHLGHDEEAARLVALLGSASPEVVKASGVSDQLKELVAVARSSTGTAYWTHTRQWWPDWIALATRLGLPEDARAVAAPEISSFADIERDLTAAKKAGKRDDFLRALSPLVSAARWQPSAAVELGSIGSEAVVFLGTDGAGLRTLLLQILAVPAAPELASEPSRLLYLGVHQFDGGQQSAVFDTIAEFNRRPTVDDSIAPAMHRLHAIAALALGRELAPTIAEIEHDLGRTDFTSTRALSVRYLFDLYMRTQQPVEAERLLDRELSNPGVIADADGSAALRSRREQLASTQAFSQHVAAWIRRVPLPWYDYAEPRGLDDPRLTDLEQVIQHPDAAFTPTEQIKLLLLAAQDPRRSLDQRQSSFRDAVLRLIGGAPDYTRLNALTASVVDDADFDTETRLRAVWAALANIADERRPDAYSRWRGHAIMAQFNDEYKTRLAVLDREVKFRDGSGEAIAAEAAALATEPVTAFRIFAMNDLFHALLRAGDLTRAQAMLAAVPSWHLAADVTGGTQTTQLNYARELRLARAAAPVHEALTAAIARFYPDAPNELPPAFRDLRHLETLHRRGQAETFAACRYLIATRRFSRTGLDFWTLVLQVLPQDEHQIELTRVMIHDALAAAADDANRAALIQIFVAYTDLDDPRIRTVLTEEFAAYRKPVELPQCYAMIRLNEINVAQRLGEVLDPKTALVDIPGATGDFFRRVLCLDVYTRAGDKTNLQTIVDQLDAGMLLHPSFVAATIPTLQLLGMDTELGLAREVALRELHRAVLASWVFADPTAAERAIGLAHLLGDPDGLPAEWIAEIARRDGAPLIERKARLARASLRQDWPEAVAQGALLVRDYPTYYAHYYPYGIALSKVGRTADAIAALTTYVNYAKNERDYEDARKLLTELQGREP